MKIWNLSNIIFRIQVLILIALFVLSSTPVSAEYPTTNILMRVFMIKYKETIGTSFTIEVDSRQYLLTAKHIVKGIKDGDSISLLRKRQWINFKVQVINCKPEGVDITVLALPQQISPTYELLPTMGGMIVGQGVYFLGFPFGMSNEANEQNNWFPLPFVKAGVLSAIDFRPKEYQVIFVDGHNNPGFSGGPIVFYDNESKQLKVAGVISSWRNQTDRVYLIPDPKNQQTSKETNLYVLSNSGILKGFGIKNAVDAIKRRPVGPEVGRPQNKDETPKNSMQRTR